MDNKETYSGKYFALHLLNKNGNISMGLASEYVYTPTSKEELVELYTFIKKYLEKD